MNEIFSFGAWLKRRRKALDLTQQELALRAGVSIGTVRKWEADERRPTRATAEHLAQVLEVPAAERPLVVKIARAEVGAERLPDAAGAVADQPQREQLRPTSRHALPVPMTSLIGRVQEVAAVTALLQRNDVRLVTLTGVGGTGKTRLAVEVAATLQHTFPNSGIFIDLAPIRDPARVLPTIAQALGVKETNRAALVASLATVLPATPLLLLLDNFEHLVTAAPELAPLLAAALHFKLLVTSRVALRLYGEHEFPVPPLEAPNLRQGSIGRTDLVSAVMQYAAVRLFLDRVQAVKPDFQLTNATAPAVAEICARLDGLPLAIELAAARVKFLPPQALLQRLSSRLHLLTGGPSDLPLRQQTLRNTIDWSYNLLSPAEQRLFTRLAVFVGGGTLEAVAAVCDGSGDLGLDVLDGLQALIDKSLVRQEVGPDGEPHVMMFETIREYSLDQLQTRGEGEALQRLHAAYFLALAEAAEPRLRGPEQAIWYARVARERDNLRAAFQHSLLDPAGTAHAVRLAVALWDFWRMRSETFSIDEGRRWLEDALARSEQVAPSTSAAWATIRGKLLHRAGDFAWREGDYDAAQARAEASLRLFCDLQNNQGMGWALQLLGHLARERGDMARAIAYFEESIARLREAGDTAMLAWSLVDLASISLPAGDPRKTTLLEQSLALFEEIGDTGGRGWLLDALASVAHQQGDFTRALQFYDQCIARFREIGFMNIVGWEIWKRGFVAIDQGDLRRAAADFTQAQELLQAERDVQGMAFGLIGFAALAVAQEQPEDAARLLAAAKSYAKRWAGMFTTGGFAKHEAAARAMLGDAAFEAAWVEGQAMTLEQAIAYALGSV